MIHFILLRATEASQENESYKQIMMKQKKNPDTYVSRVLYCGWSRPGMIRRHTDFQSVALPAELPDR